MHFNEIHSLQFLIYSLLVIVEICTGDETLMTANYSSTDFEIKVPGHLSKEEAKSMFNGGSVVR